MPIFRQQQGKPNGVRARGPDPPQAARFPNLYDAISNPIAPDDDRDRLLAFLGQGQELSNADKAGTGMLDNALTFLRGGIDIPFGAGPLLPNAGPGGNPLANFGNQQPAFRTPPRGAGHGPFSPQAPFNPNANTVPAPPNAQANAAPVTIGGPATVQAMARLSTPVPQGGFNRIGIA